MPVVTATIGAPPRAPTRRRPHRIAHREVLPRLQGIDGVSTAELTGGTTPIIDIVLDPEAMAEHGISLQQVQGILYANQITLPSGAISEGDLRLPVSTLHGYTLDRRARGPDRRRQHARGCGAGWGVRHGRYSRRQPADEPAASEEEPRPRRPAASSRTCPT